MKPNKIEQLKAICRPYDFKEKLFHLNFATLSEEERFYLKNYGIYNIKLMPKHFMLRIRMAGGRITLKKLGVITQIALQYGLEIIITSRAQIELHGLSALNVLEVWQALQQEQIITLQTLTDNVRNIVTDPYDGMAKESEIEVYPLIEKMQALFLEKPEWMGMLPRKLNVAICGTRTTAMHFFSNDLYFALAQQEHIWGFNLYLGGKNSAMAQPAGIFVLPSEVPTLFEAVARAYKTYGLRGSRAKTRLFHLLETIGIEAFIEKVAHFYPYEIQEAGELIQTKETPSLFKPLKGGSVGVCYQSRFGTIDTAVLQKIVAYAQSHSLEIRFGIDQNIYLLRLKERYFPFEKQRDASQITACAGSRYCALSLWNIKEEASSLPLEKIEAHAIQVGFSGCLKGCGKHLHCDIGLVGLRTNLFGKTQKSARVFLGGEYSHANATARLLFYAVPLPHLNRLLEVIIEAFEVSGEREFETFSKVYLNVHSEHFVTLWFLARLYLNQTIKLEKISEEKLYVKLLKQKGFPTFEQDENYVQSIKVMMHALWDDR